MKVLVEKRYFRYFDWIITGLSFGLLSIGLFFVFSATYEPMTPYSIFFKKQLFGTICGIGIYLFFSMKNFKSLTRLGYFAYFLILLLLFYTVVSGWVAMGARRWIPLYFFRVQPSEIAKLFLPAFIGFHFFGEEIEDKTDPGIIKIKFKSFIFPLFIIFLSFILIRKQPDLGTGLIILISGLILLWAIGLDKKFFIIGSILVIFGAPIIWSTLKEYQQKRILVLLGYGDTKKEGYQIEQAKIAIGSGGMFGKGLMNGTQNKLGFIPEDHSDCIFAVVCEECGFFFAIFIIFLFCALFLRIFFILVESKSILIRIVSFGLALHILISTCVNLGMVVGLLPVVGIPLPLFTYGISNLWVCLASLGWINNASIRRFYY